MKIWNTGICQAFASKEFRMKTFGKAIRERRKALGLT
jgi:hypothetical protein